MKPGVVVLGMAEEGHCAKCGAACPRRRVAVQRVTADGERGAVELWGVCCAALAMHGNKGAAASARVVAAANEAARQRQEEQRQRMARVAVPGESPIYGSARNHANHLYNRTGRPLHGSYFAEHDSGAVVRVDGQSPGDVEFFASRGFRQTSAAIPIDFTT